jgi:hypothetical protein
MLKLMASVPPLETLRCRSRPAPGPASAQRTALPGNFGDGTGVEAVEHPGRDLTAFRWAGVIDGAELLVALPGQVHLICGVAGVEAVPDLGLLAFGEMFDAVAD